MSYLLKEKGNGLISATSTTKSGTSKNERFIREDEEDDHKHTTTATSDIIVVAKTKIHCSSTKRIGEEAEVSDVCFS